MMKLVYLLSIEYQVKLQIVSLSLQIAIFGETPVSPFLQIGFNLFANVVSPYLQIGSSVVFS